jgi:glycosyltransferase involved in cell wall biosynthesis
MFVAFILIKTIIMKILLSNNHFTEVGGSETWTYSMALNLHKLGHEVDLFIDVDFNRENNIFLSNIHFKSSINIFTVNPPVRQYDLIIANHTSTINKLINVYGPEIIIQTCHQSQHALEQPHPVIKNFVSVSKEVQQHLKNKGLDSVLIENSIDCELFANSYPINERLRSVLSLAQGSKAANMIQQACDSMNLQFIQRSKWHNYTLNIQDEINQADLVVSVGRGALESLGCGRNVISLDSRTYYTSTPLGYGLLDSEEKIKQALSDNFTGRNGGQTFTTEKLIDEFKKYRKQYGVMSRNYILNNHNIIDDINKYLCFLDKKQ